MKDMLNTAVYVNDYVAYATRVGNSGEMLIGKVLEIEEDNCKVIAARAGWGKSMWPILNSKTSRWSNSSNLLVLKEVSYWVKDALDSWDKEQPNE